MSKLNPEHLYLLLDGPIYVINEHADTPVPQPEEKTEDPQPVLFEGENKQGILIILSKSGEEKADSADEEFLFKGLNALNLTAEDVAIADGTDHGTFISNIKHSKRIIFSTNPVKETLYQIEIIEDIEQLGCESIFTIRNNKDLKIKFWLGLKDLLKN
ncbi:MAG: hypothetical protein DRI71_02400 [Bacteroidetes bacterium]|nr:MAG: hypothetical protein DRI71_02400 [Bacteroidota bacterium]